MFCCELSHESYHFSIDYVKTEHLNLFEKTDNKLENIIFKNFKVDIISM